jgi:hypothetical protein
MLKISKYKLKHSIRISQIILIIQHINVEPEKGTTLVCPM